MLISANVSLESDAQVVSRPSSSAFEFLAGAREVSAAGFFAFNRRTVARCWMIRATVVGSRHMTLCCPLIE